ncbi:hypothetical protein D3C77_254960 [compost metagenome]
MKPKLLVHPSQARTISSPEEVERLLAMGWVLAAPKPRTKDARHMRELRAQRRAAGWQSLLLFLPPEDAAMVKAARRNGEDYAGLLVRLVKQQSLM